MEQNDDIPMASFLPPETVAMIKQYGHQMPGDLAFEEHMTVLFSDMRGFTELADRYDPRLVYRTINASLATQAHIVNEFGGSINKFLGDGLLACFSGEKRVEHATNCLIKMLTILPTLEGKGDLLPCRVGFGMHDGKVMFGLVGNETRKEFTVIGDVPNTAARLCGRAGPFQGLMTEDCVSLLSEEMSDRYCRFFSSLYVRGKRDPLNVFYLSLNDTEA